MDGNELKCNAAVKSCKCKHVGKTSPNTPNVHKVCQKLWSYDALFSYFSGIFFCLCHKTTIYAQTRASYRLNCR